jgi:hypothetical protein
MAKSTQVCSRGSCDAKYNSELCLVPGTGGISAFSQKDPAWQDNKTWVLCSTSSLDPDLKAINDYGIHWSIQPSKVLTIQQYKAALSTVEADVVPFHSLLQNPVTGLGNYDTSNNYGQHSKAVIIVSDTLRTVSQERIRVANWDDNDYTHLAILANCLNAGLIRLSSLVYHQSDSSLLLKKQAVAGAATMAYINVMEEKIMENEDDEAEWANDYSLLWSALSLDTFPSLR